MEIGVSILTDAETPVPHDAFPTAVASASGFNPHRRRNAGATKITPSLNN